MSLKEFIVEADALEQPLFRQGHGGSVGKLGYVVRHTPQMAETILEQHGL